jgi:hypothetical protein
MMEDRPCEITACQDLNIANFRTRKKKVVGIDLITKESITSWITVKCRPQTFYLHKKNVLLIELIENGDGDCLASVVYMKPASYETHKIQNTKEEILSIKKTMEDDLEYAIMKFDLPHKKIYKIDFVNV